MAAGSFKIYGLQKDGSRIPAAGGIIEGNNGSSGGNSGVSEIITLTQAEFDALSQTDIANYHANGVRTILVKGVSESGEPVFMRLDVAMQLSDEQKENVVKSLGLDERYGGLKMKLLWENASPTSSFAEQTVSLDLSTFEFLIIEYLAGTDWNARICYLANKGENRLYAALNGSTEQRVRQTVISDTGLQFRGGEKFTYGNPSGTGLNTGMIPVKIYGIKGVSA